MRVASTAVSRAQCHGVFTSVSGALLAVRPLLQLKVVSEMKIKRINCPDLRGMVGPFCGLIHTEQKFSSGFVQILSKSCTRFATGTMSNDKFHYMITSILVVLLLRIGWGLRAPNCHPRQSAKFSQDFRMGRLRSSLSLPKLKMPKSVCPNLKCQAFIFVRGTGSKRI